MNWTKRPEGSNWGDFGADDELGRLNLIGPEQVRAGLATVTEGRTLCLSLPLDLPGGNLLNPRRHPPRLSPTELDGAQYVNFPLANLDPALRDVISDDRVILYTQYSTQWDSLAHVGAMFDVDDNGVPEKVYYNGHRADRDVLAPAKTGGSSRAERLGVETMATHGMQGRAVLVDLAKVFGTNRRVIDRDDLMHALDATGADIRPGDFMMLRTGFAERIVEMNGAPDVEALDRTGAVLDGHDLALLQWITDSGIAAICADNYAVENPDPPLGATLKLPLHHHCLFKLGLPLAELWYLADLAKALDALGRCDFLLTAPPLRLPGALGSPVTPIATI
ncbi:hypothetical protein DSM14862_03713 (plasmid) [Sulfitobacter indolifex]|nr:hypothetical protein DSM14862_03394 [Sulfitobacter indolifex]UOA20875.1 hypothetical protein DSM14862_03713 [Sulfitobacter indolifex]